MRYIVNIKSSNDKITLGSCRVPIYKDMSYIADSSDSGVKITIYDDSDNSLKQVGYSEIVYYILNKETINGVVLESDTLETFNGMLHITIKRPLCQNLIKMRESCNIYKSTGTLNKNFLSQFNLPENTRGVIVGSDDKWKIDINNTGGFTKSCYNSDSILLNGDCNEVFIGDTIIVGAVYQDGRLNCMYEPLEKVKKYLSNGVRSVLDLYALAVVEPDLVRSYKIINKNEFVIDTLSSRYIFDVADGVYNYMLKQKLLGWRYFSL